MSFIGPSGCGKTTFLRVIADLEKPTSGSILVNGMTPNEARRKRAYGYVFQAAGPFPLEDNRAQCRAAARDHGRLAEGSGQARIGRVMDLVNLTGFEKKYPGQLSGGM